MPNAKPKKVAKSATKSKKAVKSAAAKPKKADAAKPKKLVAGKDDPCACRV